MNLVTKNEIYWRQLDIIDMEKIEQAEVSVIGIGGIGSPVLLALAKMGITNITAYDNDIIEEHNIPNQFHRVKDIGISKAKSIITTIKDLSGIQIKAHNELYEAQTLNKIVITATDSMYSRKTIFEQFMNQGKARILIDGRMAGQYFNIIIVNKDNGDDGTLYRTTIVSDEEAIQLKCTEKAIIYNTMGIASFIANIVKKYIEKDFDNISFKYIFDYMNWLSQSQDKDEYAKILEQTKKRRSKDDKKANKAIKRIRI